MILRLAARQRDSYTPRRLIHGGSGRPMRPSLPPDYHPSDDEEFMNPLQVEYFRQKLLRWRAELLAESTMVPMAIARRPRNQSAFAGSKPGRSPLSASRRKSDTSAWSGHIATSNR